MKTIKILSAAVALTALVANGAYATPITTWTVNVDTVFDTSTAVFTPDATGTTSNPLSLTWGTSTGSGQSSLVISNTPIATMVDTNGAAVPNVIITHNNNPITGNSLDSVTIDSTLTLTPFVPPGLGLPPATVSFLIDFQETPNGDDPCADGGANGVGVNVNGCADIFVIDQTALNFPFQYPDLTGPDAGTLRTYFISFFEITGGLNPLSNAACSAVGVAAGCLGFTTAEQQSTPAQFAALITTEPVGVPEPTALLLMGLGLAGLGFAKRRRNG